MQLEELKGGCEEDFREQLQKLTNVWKYAILDAEKIKGCLTYMQGTAEEFVSATITLAIIRKNAF